jgi:hypothetical protein
MPADWWNDRNDVREFISKKFEKHVFSEKSLQADIESAVGAFRNDIEANNVSLLSTVQAAVSTSDVPGMPAIDYGDFSADVTRALQHFAESSAVDSVTNLILVEIVSGVGGAAATQLLAAITTRVAATAAASAASAGGATATGAATGGGGGSAAGPGGAAIGFAVGLVVGVIIDWWMTASFEEKLSAQLNELIDEVESSVISGKDGQPGLDRALDSTCDALSDAYRESFYARIVGGTEL